MKIRQRAVRYGMAAALVLCSATLALAQPSRWGSGERRSAVKEKFKENAEEMFKELSLTPEQQQKINEQRSKAQEQAKALQEQIIAVRSRLQQELEVASPDKAKVYSIIGEMKDLQGKRMEQRVERIFELQEILTPEQFKTLQEKTKDRISKFKKEGRHEKGIGDGACRRKFGHWDSNV